MVPRWVENGCGNPACSLCSSGFSATEMARLEKQIGKKMPVDDPKITEMKSKSEEASEDDPDELMSAEEIYEEKSGAD